MVGTVPQRSSGQPIRLLHVEVVGGPDAGASLVTSDDVAVGTAPDNQLVLTDAMVSRFHLVVRRRGEHIVLVDVGSTNGTRIGPASFRNGEVAVAPDTVVDIGATRLRVKDGDVILVDGGPAELGGLRARSPAMRRLFLQIAKVAKSDVSVLLLGESGTGKEGIARALHDGSGRSAGPFVIVDCGALVPALASSELFGHERGAFTGAHKRHAGAFERAHGGTLFLDEVGDLSADVQSALLGALERKRVRALGADRDLAVDVRIVAATSRDLRGAVNQGAFRLDLYHRLAGVHLVVPPLRDRPEDVALLIELFLREAGDDRAVEAVFPPAALAPLLSHAWPGNVRELKNLVAGTLALGEVLPVDTVDAANAANAANASAGTSNAKALSTFREAKQAAVDAFERAYLRQLLELSGGNVREAARLARMDRNYLTELLRRHALRDSDRSP